MYRMCEISYIEFWEFTPAETSEMLEIAYEKLKFDAIKHAEILMWTANAPHAQRRDKKLFQLDDFLPDFAKQGAREQTPEEIERLWWNEAR